ncbi:MAG: stage V sporulation protein AC [Coprobacillaceae bacterium]
MNTKQYDKLADDLKPDKNIFGNCVRAFLYGGAIGAIGQGLLEFYMYIYDCSQKEAIPMMTLTIVLVAVILTGLGLYDKIARKAGAGTFIPITGFANSMASSAIEGRSEGLVTGIGPGMFKLGGTVIMFGIVASFILGGIRYVIEYFG